jgi:hypothetical protein
MTSVVLSPLRKRGDVSKIPAAPPAVLLQDSGASPMATLSHTHGSSTSLTGTLACTQGSGTSLPDTLAPSYTPHCTPGPSPCIYKREVQGLPARGSRGVYKPGGRRGFRRVGGGGGGGETVKRTGSLSLSLSRTLVTHTASTPWCEITRAMFPSCVPSCANPSGQGHAATKFTGRHG